MCLLIFNFLKLLRLELFVDFQIYSQASITATDLLTLPDAGSVDGITIHVYSPRSTSVIFGTKSE